MLLNITTIFVALIAIYLVYDMVELIKARQFSLARSRTYAVLLGLLMCGRMIYGYFTAQPGAEESSIPNRGLFVICTIGLAVVYTAHRPDRRFGQKTRRHEIRTAQTDLFRVHGRSADFLHMDEEITGLSR